MTVNDVLVQTEVQDGIHHARHGCARTGADGNEKRILEIAELLAGDLSPSCSMYSMI